MFTKILTRRKLIQNNFILYPDINKTGAREKLKLLLKKLNWQILSI